MNISIRLLIADDDPVMRLLLGAIARSDPGIELVGAAEDADEAIALAGAHRPDVVLLDVEMPGGGGPRAAAEIRAMLPGARILALSAHAESAAMAAAGADGYVVKGTPPAEVARRIRGEP